MEMTSKTFLAILRAALAGEKPVPDREILPDEWERLFQMAGIHKVLPLFYEAVYDCLSLLRWELPALPGIKNQVRQQVMLQTVRTAEFLELNDRLQAAGVRPLVVKGIICRNLYPLPDHRPSGDEDVLIPAEKTDVCHRVLLDFGMHSATEEREMATAYEIPYRKAGSTLYIELHKHLFPPESAAYGDLNRFFVDAFRRAVPEEIGGKTVYTLAPTDHLFYLLCHALKHFLHSGFGIRQVCDIVLYANQYGERIQWARVLRNCTEIRGEKFAAALFQIGQKYLGFDPEKACYPDSWQAIRVDERPMLEDLLSGGLYGDASMSRKHSSNITLDAVAAQKQGRMSKGALLASAFPPASKLAGRYPYLKKRPWLLPVAWSCRLWAYSRETKNTHRGNAAEALKIGSRRIELLKIYGILK